MGNVTCASIPSLCCWGNALPSRSRRDNDRNVTNPRLSQASTDVAHRGLVLGSLTQLFAQLTNLRERLGTSTEVPRDEAVNRTEVEMATQQISHAQIHIRWVITDLLILDEAQPHA